MQLKRTIVSMINPATPRGDQPMAASLTHLPACPDHSRLPPQERSMFDGLRFQHWQHELRPDRVLVLTDDERIGLAVDRFGGEWQMTPTECASGTDRIAWAAREWPAEIRAVVNIQGDEPLIEPEVVDRLARHLADNPDDPIVTLATAATAKEMDDPNAVKVVCDREGYALYFSRSAIPYRRDPGSGSDVAPVLKHLGLYGYQTSALLRFAELPPSPLERTESLEQLRALENRMRLRVLITDWSSPGVDTRDDLARVERLLVERAERTTGS